MRKLESLVAKKVKTTKTKENRSASQSVTQV